MIKPGKLRCSFCGKDETEVLKLVAGPRVYICDECVEVANQIMNDSNAGDQPSGPQPPVRRKLLTRVKEFLGGGDAGASRFI